MVVLGVVLKHDNKMTGDSVQYIYQFLYFRGANFHDIVEAMYLSLIVLGISSLVCCMLGLSDIFKSLRHTAKIKLVSSYEISLQFERNKSMILVQFFLSCLVVFFSICSQNIFRLPELLIGDLWSLLFVRRALSFVRAMVLG